jgi:hypothetical protein
MRSPKSSNPSNIADKLANGAYTKTLSKQEIRTWQLSQLKQILKETNNPKPYIEKALCGGYIMPEFHPILLTILRPINATTAALIIEQANIYHKLEHKLIQIIIKAANDNLVIKALQNTKLSDDSIQQLLSVCDNSKFAFTILTQCKISEENQINLIKKLSDEDTINLHRQNIFYPETKLLSNASEKILKDRISKRDPNDKSENAEIVFLDD